MSVWIGNPDDPSSRDAAHIASILISLSVCHLYRVSFILLTSFAVQGPRAARKHNDNLVKVR